MKEVSGAAAGEESVDLLKGLDHVDIFGRIGRSEEGLGGGEIVVFACLAEDFDFFESFFGGGVGGVVGGETDARIGTL